MVKVLKDNSKLAYSLYCHLYDVSVYLLLVKMNYTVIQLHCL